MGNFAEFSHWIVFACLFLVNVTILVDVDRILLIRFTFGKIGSRYFIRQNPYYIKINVIEIGVALPIPSHLIPTIPNSLAMTSH